jgi:membrane protein implicated in regulation of membrane protease activity
MIQELISSGALNVVYALVLVISFFFALLSLIGVELGDAIDFDFEADADSVFSFVSISPFALAMFGSTFGLVGLLTRFWLEMGPIPSILWSTGLGLLFGGAGQAFFLLVLSPSKSSHFSLETDAIGREAEVTISIPEDGQGRVTYNNHVSGRVTLGARSADGKPIRAGQIVIIERIVGRVVTVRPLPDA